MGTLPRWPALAAHVLPRKHVHDGRVTIVLHDVREGGVVTMGDAEWGVLACADGTRDVEGIRRAAGAAGFPVSVEDVTAFLSGLADAGLLATEDVPIANPGPTAGTIATPGERPLEVLSDYRFTCDGRGGCCRTYASIIFTPDEAARARVVCPDVLDGARHPEAVHLPLLGSSPHGMRAVAFVDNRCAYLDGDDRCAIHAKAGAAAKPAGCQMFPATFVDDGAAVRVSVVLECSCSFVSAGATRGDPLVDPSVTRRADLPPLTFIERLRETVTVRAGVTASRTDLRAFTKAHAAGPGTRDAVAWWWSLAEVVEREGLVGPERVTVRSPDPVALRPWLVALAVRAAHFAHESQRWRGKGDLVREASDWIAQSAAAMLEGDAVRQWIDRPAMALHEDVYARSSMHGYQFVGEAPLVVTLRDAAVRMLVARAMASRPAGAIAAGAAHPVALLEALMRGHGLHRYVDQVGRVAGSAPGE